MNDVQSRGWRACFIGVGVSIPGKALEHQTPVFDIDEKALYSALELFSRLIKSLKSSKL